MADKSETASLMDRLTRLAKARPNDSAEIAKVTMALWDAADGPNGKFLEALRTAESLLKEYEEP